MKELIDAAGDLLKAVLSIVLIGDHPQEPTDTNDKKASD